MRIIAVNISRTIHGIGEFEATRRAWKLNKSNAEKHDFVIGLDNGKIYPFALQKVKVERDDEHKDRVKFNLKKCSPSEEADIRQYVKGISFKYVTVKYIK